MSPQSLKTNKYDDTIKSVRRKFYEIYEQNRDAFDLEDLNRLNGDDWQIKRYVISQFGNEESALKMLIDSMKWRKEFGVNQRNDNFFPQEFYAIGGLFQYSNDRNGYATLYLRIKLVKKIPEICEYFKMFLVHVINKIDTETHVNGWVLIIDATDAGISNCDFDMLYFLITLLNNYFPAGLRYVLCHELPWMLQGVWKLAKTMIPSEPRKLIKFSTNADINHYVESDALPDYLGGTSKRDYRIVPEGCPNAIQFGIIQAKLTIETVKKVMNYFRPFLDYNYRCKQQNDHLNHESF